MPKKLNRKSESVVSSQNSRNSTSHLLKVPKFITKIEKTVSPEQLRRAERAYYFSNSLTSEPDQYAAAKKTLSYLNNHNSASRLPCKKNEEPLDGYPLNSLSKHQIS